MSLDYKKIGEFIRLVDSRNEDLGISTLLGVNLKKEFMPSVANTIGTDLSKYKVITNGQFGCKLMSVGRDKMLPISRLRQYDNAIMSSAYFVFEVIDESNLDPEYLFMWLKRSESDRYLWFLSGGDIRGRITWEDLCSLPIRIPSIEEQRAIVEEYKTVTDRIKLNEQINTKLEETAQALYKHWFVDFDHSVNLSELIQINPRHSIHKGENIPYVEMANLQESSYSISGYRIREYKSGSKFIYGDTLLARITPCLENGKTAFNDVIPKGQIAFGSTEFIVMRPKDGVSPYYVYFLARDETFREYAISSMVGSSGRQRVESNYLKNFKVPALDLDKMSKFHNQVTPLFIEMKNNNDLILLLKDLKVTLLSKMSRLKINFEESIK